MAERIVIAFRSLGREIVMRFRPPEEPVLDPYRQGIGRHFGAVGVHLSNAAEEYAKTHPEIPVNA